MKIILHVGTEKTGSTSIQSTFQKSKSKLIEEGWLFPETKLAYSHINLTACALEGQPGHPIRQLLNIKDESAWLEFYDKTLDNLSKEIRKFSPDVLLISDEHINVHLQTIKQLNKLKYIFEQFGTVSSVVVYLRRQDSFRLSLFSEAVKVGNLSNFDLDNPLPVFKTIPFRYDYLTILNNLSTVFGEDLLKPRIFEPSGFSENNIVNDFVKLCSVPLPFESLFERKRNTSIDAQVIKTLAKVSSYLKSLDNRIFEGAWQLILKICQENFKGPGPVLRQEWHELFMSQFYDHNMLVKEKYFQDLARTELFSSGENKKRNGGVLIYPDCSLGWPKIISIYLQSLVYMK
jgi:hypothetical protein